MKKPKKTTRKFVLIEVETTWTNDRIRDHAYNAFFQGGRGEICRAFQVHVNTAQKEPKR